MFDVFFLLAPVFSLFFLGILLRKTGIIDEKGASFLFSFIHKLTLPTLALSLFPYVTLSAGMLAVPLISILVTAAMPVGAIAAKKLLHLPDQTFAAILNGSILMNTSFMLPFVKPLFGAEGVALLFLFNAANTLTANFFLGILQSSRYPDGTTQIATNGFSFLPLTIPAIVCGIAMNLLHLSFVPVTAVILHDIGELTIPLLLLASGASVKLPKVDMIHLFSGITIRMAGGAATGLGVAAFFGLEEPGRSVLALCAAAPAALIRPGAQSAESAENSFSEAFASTGMLGAMILIPLLLLLL